MGALFKVILGWIFQESVVKFVAFGALYLVLSLLMPLVVSYLGGFINPAGLSGAFSGIPGGVWFFLDFFQIGYGLPLMISAHVARFLIRRLPVVG